MKKLIWLLGLALASCTTSENAKPAAVVIGDPIYRVDDLDAGVQCWYSYHGGLWCRELHK